MPEFFLTIFYYYFDFLSNFDTVKTQKVRNSKSRQFHSEFLTNWKALRNGQQSGQRTKKNHGLEQSRKSGQFYKRAT